MLLAGVEVVVMGEYGVVEVLEMAVTRFAAVVGVVVAAVGLAVESVVCLVVVGMAPV